MNEGLEGEWRSVGWIHGCLRCYEQLGEGTELGICFADKFKVVVCALEDERVRHLKDDKKLKMRRKIIKKKNLLKIVTKKSKSTAEADVIINAPVTRIHVFTDPTKTLSHNMRLINKANGYCEYTKKD